jgi:hypothetical protein
MKIKHIKQLHSGDQVFWTDPDNGTCSRHYTIGSIEYKGDGVISITDKDGSSLECFAAELS